MPESGSLGVETHGYMRGALFAQQFFKSVDEAEDGRGVHSGRCDTRHAYQSVIRPEHQGVCIKKEKAWRIHIVFINANKITQYKFISKIIRG